MDKRCELCHRPMAADSVHSMGPICRARMKFGGNGRVVNPIKCYLLGRRDDGSSRWMVRDNGTEYRVALFPVSTPDGNQINSCSCEIYKAIGKDCLHIDAVIENNDLLMRNAA